MAGPGIWLAGRRTFIPLKMDRLSQANLDGTAFEGTQG